MIPGKVLIVLVAAALVGIGGFFAFKYAFDTHVDKACAPGALSTPEDPCIQDETANWKTYSNNKISFKYPPHYVIAKESDSGILFGSKTGSPFEINFSKIAEYTKGDRKLCSVVNPPIDCLERGISTISIDGRPARETYYIGAQGPITWHIIEMDDPQMEIGFALVEGYTDEDFKKILSTFKFL